MGVDKLLARYLVPLVEIVHGVKNGIAAWNVYDGPIGKHFIHAGDEGVPFPGAVKIVAHEKAATIQKIAQLGGLQVSKVPMTDFNRIQPGPIIDVIGVFGSHRFLYGTRLDTREAS